MEHLGRRRRGRRRGRRQAKLFTASFRHAPRPTEGGKGEWRAAEERGLGRACEEEGARASEEGRGAGRAALRATAAGGLAAPPLDAPPHTWRRVRLCTSRDSTLRPVASALRRPAPHGRAGMPPRSPPALQAAGGVLRAAGGGTDEAPPRSMRPVHQRSEAGAVEEADLGSWMEVDQGPGPTRTKPILFKSIP